MWWRAGLAAMLAVFVVATPATAHVRSTTGYSLIRSEGSAVSYRLSLEYELPARAAGLGPAAVGGALTAYLRPRVEVFLDDVACEMSLVSAETVQRHGIGYALLTLSYECPGSPAGSYRVDYRAFAARRVRTGQPFGPVPARRDRYRDDRLVRADPVGDLERPGPAVGRSGEWLDLGDVRVDGDRVIATAPPRSTRRCRPR